MGRPRKYATQAEAARAHATAKATSDRQRYLRKKHGDAIPRYVAYMPVPSDVPSTTPPDLLLRSDCVGPSTAPTMRSDNIQDGPASATEHPQPQPLPLPLALQPPAFYLRPEDDDVQKEQQEQRNKEAAVGQETYTQAYEDAVLAQLDDADSIASSQQLLHEASLFARSSGSGCPPKKQRQRSPQRSLPRICQQSNDSDDFLTVGTLLQARAAVDTYQDQQSMPSPLPLPHRLADEDTISSAVKDNYTKGKLDDSWLEDSELENSRQEDSRLEESDLEDSKSEDSESENSESADSKLEYSESEDSESEDSESEDSESEDSELEDSESEDSESEDSESEDSESEDSEPDNSEPEDIIGYISQQLRTFQGCSDAEHKKQAQEHAFHHCQPHIHPDCHSLSDITSILQGTFTSSATPLPDVLGSTKMMPPTPLPQCDFHSIFEGRISEGNANNPPPLALEEPLEERSPSPTPSTSSGSGSSSLPSISQIVATATTTATPTTANLTTATNSNSPLPNQSSLPRNLCLDSHHSSSSTRKEPEISFDIDSTCCFPTSLAVAKNGIKLNATAEAALNLSASIHFAVCTTQLNAQQELTSIAIPIHLLPHYCLGRIVNMDDMHIFICFPNLHESSSYSSSNCLSIEDQELWFDGILLPCLNQALASPNKKLYYPASKRVAEHTATAAATEGFVRKFSSRRQIIDHTVQQEDLELLWPLICNRIEEAVAVGAPEARFAKPLLFISHKNSKLQYMKSGAAKDILQLLPMAYDAWLRGWTFGMDERFYSKEDTFVDLAKQTTSWDSALPFDQLSSDTRAEVYIWRQCCLKKYLATRRRHCHRRHRKRKQGAQAPEVTYYPFATFGQAGGITIASKYGSAAYIAGLIYSQFYSLIKVPFDAAKVYIFNNDAMENLALDPAYVQTLQHVGGAVAFSPKVCEISYLCSKSRAHVNFEDNQWRSYGVREEHRLSMKAVEKIVQQWRQWQQEESVAEEDLDETMDADGDVVESSKDDEDLYEMMEADGEVVVNRQDVQRRPPLPPPLPPLLPPPLPLPYYVFSSKDMFAFLRAQLNRYCFLFEHVYAWTGKTHSLPEFMMMVLALRALRFSYGSGILCAESLLYKDQWQNKKGQRVEGIGIKTTMHQCGFGWFLPKINWSTIRLLPQYTDHFLAGNMLLHSEYQRRWRAVRDLGDVYIRLHQAGRWFATYNVQGSQRREEAWLEYLLALNIQQFHADTIQHALTSSNKTHPELSATATASSSSSGGTGLAKLSYCLQGMHTMFEVDEQLGPPHTAMGNVVAITSTWELLELLFGWEESPPKQRGPWQKKTYRLIFRQTYDLIASQLGARRAQEWYHQFLTTVLLTHWVLPYATATAFLPLSKTNKKKGMKGRMIWFSSVLQEPPAFCPLSWPAGLARSLSNITTMIQLDALSRSQSKWRSSDLIDAYCKLGLFSKLSSMSFFKLGFSQDSTTLVPTWEHGKPLPLQMVLDIRDKTLDELDIYMQQEFELTDV
jgi:hypothetical protein